MKKLKRIMKNLFILHYLKVEQSKKAIIVRTLMQLNLKKIDEKIKFYMKILYFILFYILP